MSQTSPKIYAAMVEVMENVGAVSKDRNNKEQGYKFRGIEDVYNAVQSAMVKARVFNIASMIERKDSERKTKSGSTMYAVTCTYKFTFFAEDGSSVESIISADGCDTGDKAANKAISFCHKYALLTAFNIRTTEEDEKDPDETRAEYDQKPPVAPVVQPKPNAFTRCSQDQIKLVMVLLKQLGTPEEDAKIRFEQLTGKKSRTEWTVEDAKKVINSMQQALEAKKIQDKQTMEQTNA